MPPAVPSPPPRAPLAAPLSSRGVLVVGTLALVCLALFAALALEAAVPEPLALDGPSVTPTTAVPAALRTVEAPERGPDVVFWDEPEPIPTGMLTALERATEEPLGVELTRLLDALHHGFGARSVQVEPTIRPYAFRLAGRLDVHAASFRVIVVAPDAALAEARAATLRNLFATAGVAPGRLTVAARRGPPALYAEAA